jgi:predicted metal-dependent phosphoesterase TrpH
MSIQGYSRADIHIHTIASDGFATVQQVLDQIARLGTLSVIAITDHDVLDASLWAYSQRTNYPFEIIPGLEVSSADGHVLALWVTQPVAAGMSLKETASAIHEQGGVAVVAHPFEITVCTDAVKRYLRQPETVREAGIDAVEIHNAGTITPAANLLARRLAAQLGMTVTGGSDGHSLEALGRGWTRFPGSTAEDLRLALMQGTTTAGGRSWPLADYMRLLPHWFDDRLPIPSAIRSRLALPQNRQRTLASE